MLRLLNIEFQKLKYNKSVKIITITYFVLITFIALIASIEINFFGIKYRIADQGIFNFPYIWHFTSFIASWAKLFLAIVIVSMIANEYSYRTLKQNLIDGLSKKEFIASKYLTVIVFSLISTIFLFIISLILGLKFSDYNEFSIIFSDLEYILAYFVKLLGFFSFCMFLGILIKRSAFALGFMIIWWVIENIIFLLLKYQLFKETNIAENIVQFFPLESISNLIKEPITRLNFIQSTMGQIGSKLEIDYSIHWYQILVVLIWSIIFLKLSHLTLVKRDL